MKEITSSDNLEDLGYPTAGSLTEITITPEQRFDEQKHKLLNELFTDMAGSARKGINYYYADFHSESTEIRLINDAEEILLRLGYQVSREMQDTKQGKMDTLTITWARPVEA